MEVIWNNPFFDCESLTEARGLLLMINKTAKDYHEQVYAYRRFIYYYDALGGTQYDYSELNDPGMIPPPSDLNRFGMEVIKNNPFFECESLTQARKILWQLDEETNNLEQNKILHDQFHVYFDSLGGTEDYTRPSSREEITELPF